MCDRSLITDRADSDLWDDDFMGLNPARVMDVSLRPFSCLILFRQRFRDGQIIHQIVPFLYPSDQMKYKPSFIHLKGAEKEVGKEGKIFIRLFSAS
jgi:hypothetical protein